MGDAGRSASGCPRAALARRFTELVGEPPMTYLTGWRLAMGRRPRCASPTRPWVGGPGESGVRQRRSR
ncbi:hypothetical protein [Nonomuraea dietziae]|uniref:hypothetical protein n=1 Tax=Nonomuraea dietziae TaxID=65515 RepID=UPI0031D75BAF